jgi:hypothetical protein
VIRMLTAILRLSVAAGAVAIVAFVLRGRD